MRRLLFSRDFWGVVVRSKVFWCGVLAYLLYWAAVPFIPQKTLVEISSTFVLFSAGAIFVTWLPGLVGAIASGSRLGGWQIVIAINLTFFAIVQQRAWALIWSIKQRPDWMLNHPFLGSTSWLLALVSLLFLLAPGNSDGRIPRNNLITVVITVAIAAAAAGSLATAIYLGAV